MEGAVYVLPDEAKAAIATVLNDPKIDDIERMARLGRIVMALASDANVDAIEVAVAFNKYMALFFNEPEGHA